MTYPQLLANVVAIQRAIPGIREVYDHEPGSLGAVPAFYNRLEALPVVQHSLGGERHIAYTLTMRLCLRHTQTSESEQQLAAFITPVLDAFDTNKALVVNGVRGAITSQVSEATAGYIRVAGTLYRVLSFTLVATTEETVAYA